MNHVPHYNKQTWPFLRRELGNASHHSLMNFASARLAKTHNENAMIRDGLIHFASCVDITVMIWAKMTLEELLKKKRGDILRVAARYGARNVRVFGSVVRGEEDEKSDVDFLVEMEPGKSLFDLGGLQFELESLLGRRVDVVTERGLKARIRDRVLREAVPV